MEYTDNPRKIYGRVEIIYSDAEISKDIVATVSANSTISHPDEVHESHLTPTVKACTMDGNSTMDGSFQMIDDTCFCGWWSGALADANGNFANPPWLELTFVQRPIISWLIIGDQKLGQYPVNFKLEYKRNGAVVHTENITNNTQMQVRVTPYIEDITSIRITITRWSKGNACVKLLKFYDRLAELYEGDAIQMFEVNEEMSSAEGNYNINSDTMTVTIYNADRKFDRGYLRSLMILDRKLKPSLGIEKNGVVEYTDLGTFYSDEWQVSQDSQWVKCLAVDRLLRLQNKTYVGFPLTSNASLYEIAEDVLVKIGYTSAMYKISEDLKDVIVPMAYLPKQSTWDALQEIANAGLCKIYIDRLDRINIRSEQEPTQATGVAIHKGNMFTYQSSISLTEFANRIHVEYCDVSLSEEIVSAATVDVAIDPGASLELTLDYTVDIAYGLIESSNANIKLTNFSSGVNACTVTATNISSTIQTATLTVTGNAIEISTKTLTVQDDDSVRNSGVTEYSHPASELVQSHEHAEYICRTLLARMHAGEGVITTQWRGNPALELGNKYESADRFDDKSELICEHNKFTYDGGLKQETRGRKI